MPKNYSYGDRAPPKVAWGVDWRDPGQMPAEDRRPGLAIASEHAFLGWIAQHHRSGIEIRKERDVYLSTALAGRFAVRVENDGEIALGIQVADHAALKSIGWGAAALMGGFRGPKRLVLSTLGEGRIRLFIPVSEGICEKLAVSGASVLRIRQIKARGSVIGVWKGAAEAELPFQTINVAVPESEEAA